jgi:hypothetical protein
MTSVKQFEANRRNARKSTGPATEAGKLRSRCNAVRHGLTASTVITILEDAADYQAFEAAIIADYDAQSAVERELVLRLASLLWRLRRATAMETGLFEIEAGGPPKLSLDRTATQNPLRDMFDLTKPPAVHDNSLCAVISTNGGELAQGTAENGIDTAADLGRRFLGLANSPNYVLDRLGRYEASLWRQVFQVLYALDELDRRKPQERGRGNTSLPIK